MKYIFLLFLFSCSTQSIYQCDNKVGIEKESCVENYKNQNRHKEYHDFRAGGLRQHLDRR